MKKIILTLLWFCSSVISLLAHGDVHERIVALSKEIKAHPDSAMLYLMRGELYNEHEQYKNAIRDFKTSKRKGLTSNRLFLAFAKSYKAKGKHKKALRQLEHILEREPTYVRALRLKGNVLLDKKDFCAAIVPLEAAINIVEERLVENYLEAASACQQCAAEGAKERAVAFLEKGIADLGPLLILYENLKEMALQQEDYNKAIIYQTAIIDYSIRKEKPYFERALLYLKIKEAENVLKDLQVSQNLFNQLPARFQKMTAMQQLQQQITETLQLLGKDKILDGFQ